MIRTNAIGEKSIAKLPCRVMIGAVVALSATGFVVKIAKRTQLANIESGVVK